LLKLALGARHAFGHQEAREKRRLLNFVLSNSTWKNGELIARFRQPFDIIVEATATAGGDSGGGALNSPGHPVWLRERMSNHNDWTRRDVSKAGLSMLLAAPVAGAAGGEGAVAVGLVLRETAGLRRFSFPVHALLPGDLPGRNARLLREGRPVDAQFRRVAGADGRPALALDFVSGVGPLETERYVVEVGDGVEPGPEPTRAVRVGDGPRRQKGGSQRVGCADVRRRSTLAHRDA
jgi:hypothetical protein